MLLAIDIGNTQTVVGAYARTDETLPHAMWRISTNKLDTADNICATLLPLMTTAGLGKESIRAAMMSSVVPALADSWAHAVKSLCGAETRMCTAESAAQAGLFETDYPRMAEIGADRVADAVAARALYGTPVVVVDFGTATNIEVIDKDGRFIGGIIAPGLMTGANALFEHATRLAATEMQVPPNPIGRSTEQALQSGILYGEAGRVDGLLRRVFAQLGCVGAASGGTCEVVATGGLAELVAEQSEEITKVLPELTLEGLRLIALATKFW